MNGSAAPDVLGEVLDVPGELLDVLGELPFALGFDPLFEAPATFVVVVVAGGFNTPGDEYWS